MFQDKSKRNLTKRAKYYKFKSKAIRELLENFSNKKKIFSKRITRYEKEISECLNDYKQKSNYNLSLYENYKKNYEDFKRINSKIRDEQKPKEKKLIFDLLNSYYQKRRLTMNKTDIKENIFESSPLIEDNLNRLKMDYILNFDDLKKEMKENEKNNRIYQKIAKKYDIDLKKEVLDNINNRFPGGKIARQINNINAVKFMKKVDTIAVSKILASKLSDKKINRTEIRRKLDELDKKADIEEKYDTHRLIRSSLKGIDKLQKELKSLENEESNYNPVNILAKNAQKGKSLFYIPTIVKSFPELLYDKLNKNTNNLSKNIATNDSSSPSLIKPNEKSNSQRLTHRSYFNQTKRTNNKTMYKLNNNYLNKFKDMLNTSRIKSKQVDNKIFKRTMKSKSMQNFNKNKIYEEKDEITLMYNKLIDMSSEDRNSTQNATLMRTFLKEKNNKYVNSINEINPKNYYKTLKKIHFQLYKDLETERFYDSNGLLYNNKTKYLFNEMKNFHKTMRVNEKLLIKTLLLDK